MSKKTSAATIKRRVSSPDLFAPRDETLATQPPHETPSSQNSDSSEGFPPNQEALPEYRRRVALKNSKANRENVAKDEALAEPKRRKTIPETPPSQMEGIARVAARRVASSEMVASPTPKSPELRVNIPAALLPQTSPAKPSASSTSQNLFGPFPSPKSQNSK